MSTVVTLPTGATATLRAGLATERQNRLVEAANIAATPALLKIAGALEVAGIAEEDRTKPEFAEAVGRAYAETPLSREEADSVLQLQDATIVAYVESWTLAAPVPTMDTVQDLDKGLYDALAQATRSLAGPKPRLDVSEQVTPEGGLDHESPSTGSSSSNALSLDAPESPSIPSLPSGSESTNTASSTD